MAVTIKKGAPSLRNFMNRGGKFGDWRHQFTNYDAVCKTMRMRYEFGGVEYLQMVSEFVSQCLEGLSNEAHRAIVVAWSETKGLKNQ